MWYRTDTERVQTMKHIKNVVRDKQNYFQRKVFLFKQKSIIFQTKYRTIFQIHCKLLFLIFFLIEFLYYIFRMVSESLMSKRVNHPPEFKWQWYLNSDTEQCTQNRNENNKWASERSCMQIILIIIIELLKTQTSKQFDLIYRQIQNMGANLYYLYWLCLFVFTIDGHVYCKKYQYFE